jgi:hypothetical protein
MSGTDAPLEQLVVLRPRPAHHGDQLRRLPGVRWARRRIRARERQRRSVAEARRLLVADGRERARFPGQRRRLGIGGEWRPRSLQSPSTCARFSECQRRAPPACTAVSGSP